MTKNRFRNAGLLAGAALAWVAPHVALAQTLEAQGQKFFQGMGTTTSIAFGVIFFTVGAFLLVIGGWNLYAHSRRENRGEGKMGASVLAFIAGFIILGGVAWAALGTNSFTGAAPGIRNPTSALTFG